MIGRVAPFVCSRENNLVERESQCHRSADPRRLPGGGVSTKRDKIHRFCGILKVVLLSLAGQHAAAKKSMVPCNGICRIHHDKDEQDNDILCLDYSSCPIKHFQLPPGISPNDVTHLNLEDTNLKVIPPIVFQMSNLKVLDVRHNCLTSVPPEISNLHKLKVLKLAMNSLKKLPEDVVRMKSLEILHLGANEFTRLPKKFGNLTLKVLWINDNCFDHFPPQITNIKTLEKLYAHGNQIKTMPEEISKLSNMTTFLVHKNKLNSLPEAIVTLMKSNLTDFDYHANTSIKTFPPGFHHAVSKLNDSTPLRKDTRRKSFRVKRKHTNVTESNKSRSGSTTEAAKAKGDNNVDAKTTEEQAVGSETEPSQLPMANQAAENGQLDAAKQGEQLPSPTMAQDVGAKAINYNYYTTNIYTGPFFNGGHNDYPTTGVSNTDSCREKRTMDTKDPLNGLIQFTAYEASTSWRDIARQLGLRANEIEQIEWEYRGKMKECCIKALNLWRERKGKHATVEVLKKALNDAERKDVVDEFDAANCELQDVATSHSGQVEEETSITETENYNHVESDSSRHYHRETTTDQVNDPDPQAETQPKNATTTSTLPKRPIKECSSRRCLFSKYTASHQETRGLNDDPRSLPSTCAQPTSVESQPGRKKRQGKSWSFNKRDDKRRFEMSQHPTDRGGRHQSSPGPNSSAGHETGARDKFRFPWKKNKSPA